MGTVESFITILVGVISLLSIVLWCGKFIKTVSIHDKKFDEQGAKIDEQSRNLNEQAKLMAEQGHNIAEQGAKIDVQSRSIDKLVRLVESHDHRILSLSDAMTEVKNDMKGMKSDLADLRVSVASINGFLSSGIGKDFSLGGTNKNSPRTLNERGLKLYNDVNGKNFLEKNKEELFAYLDRLAPKTAYDVENEALMALMTKTSTDMFIPIKSFLYNCPEIELNGKPYEITLADVCRVLYVPLRDMYLETHPDIVK